MKTEVETRNLGPPMFFPKNIKFYQFIDQNICFQKKSAGTSITSINVNWFCIKVGVDGVQGCPRSQFHCQLKAIERAAPSAMVPSRGSFP